MSIKHTATLIGAAVAATLAASPAYALNQGDWLFRIGASNVSPKSNNSSIVNVDSDTQLSFTIGYMLTPHWGVEALASLPFKHDIRLNSDGSKVATTKHLPPTFTLQYYFQPSSSIRPYLGAGVNYTKFFNVKTTGALAGTSLKLGDSWGLAGQLGVDVDINKNWFLNANVRYIDITTRAKSSAVGNFDVHIDPWVYSLGIGTTF
jgi:outer membrane protein